METFRVLYIEEGIAELWTLEDILSHINADRSNEWTDYDASDWKEGWNEWVADDGVYKLIDEEAIDNEEAIEIQSEWGDDDEFQAYYYEDGTRVPQDEHVGLEYGGKFYIFSELNFG